MKVTEKKLTLKNGKEILLKSPEPADAMIALEHFRRIFKEHYRNFNRDAVYWETVTEDHQAQKIQEAIQSQKQFMISAWDERTIVGFIVVTGGGAPFQKFSAHIGMGIETEYQNTGLGTELLGHAVEEAKRAGFHSLQLEVRTFNKAAIALYEKLGFRRVGELKEVAYFDDKFWDEFIYQKLLTVNG